MKPWGAALQTGRSRGCSGSHLAPEEGEIPLASWWGCEVGAEPAALPAHLGRSWAGGCPLRCTRFKPGLLLPRAVRLHSTRLFLREPGMCCAWSGARCVCLRVPVLKAGAPRCPSPLVFGCPRHEDVPPTPRGTVACGLSCPCVSHRRVSGSVSSMPSPRAAAGSTKPPSLRRLTRPVPQPLPGLCPGVGLTRAVSVSCDGEARAGQSSPDVQEVPRLPGMLSLLFYQSTPLD